MTTVDLQLPERNRQIERRLRIRRELVKCLYSEPLRLKVLTSVRFDLIKGCWIHGDLPRVINKLQPRKVYVAFRGQFDLDLELDHTCRVTNCLNPWHLSAVTKAENLRRRFLTAEEHFALREEAA